MVDDKSADSSIISARWIWIAAAVGVGVIVIAVFFLRSGSFQVAEKKDDGKLKIEAEKLYNKGEFKKALPKLKEYVQANPKDTKTRSMLAGSYMLSGELEKAAEQYEQILETEPDDADTRYRLGIMLRQLGRVGQAAKELKEAVKLKPSSPLFLSELAKTYVKQKRFKAAITSWEKALGGYAGNDRAKAITYSEIGDTYMLMSDRESASAAYRSGLELEPDNSYLKSQLTKAEPQEN